MTPIGLFYGTDTGFTEIVVKLFVEEFELVAPNLLTVHNIADGPITILQQYEHLIIGCPTWDIGQLQADWDKAYNELDTLDLSGKQVAIFGLGINMAILTAIVMPLAFWPKSLPTWARNWSDLLQQKGMSSLIQKA